MGDAEPQRGLRLERGQAAVRRALSEGAVESSPKRRAFTPIMLGGKSIDVMLAEQDSVIHPLLRAVQGAQRDLEQGKIELEDHGSWDGRWSLLSRTIFEALETGNMTQPPGGGHKEIIWSRLSEEDRTKFREAAGEQWDKWMENGALKILSLDESRAVLQDDLERRGELARVLTPRFALTDKNSAHRTPTNQLPLKASARIVVPGFRDLENLRRQLRRDAPTGSRQAQHVLFSLAACHPSWFLRGADVRAAFLKGDPYVQRILYMTGTDGSKGPSIPIARGAVAKVLKGIFGLADAPREWWLRLDREMKNHGWTRSTLDGALWYFWRKNDKTRRRTTMPTGLPTSRRTTRSSVEW